MNYFSPMEVFVIHLKMAFTVALAVSFPYECKAFMVCVRFNIAQRSFLSSKRAYIRDYINIICNLNFNSSGRVKSNFAWFTHLLLFELGLFLAKRFEKNKN
ncbi:MAG: hypothetical protein LBG23_01585 [Endomicrobium sp.]|nr:hypothetical protein [Endomicrobium sp.]